MKKISMIVALCLVAGQGFAGKRLTDNEINDHDVHPQYLSYKKEKSELKDQKVPIVETYRKNMVLHVDLYKKNGGKLVKSGLISIKSILHKNDKDYWEFRLNNNLIEVRALYDVAYMVGKKERTVKKKVHLNTWFKCKFLNPVDDFKKVKELLWKKVPKLLLKNFDEKKKIESVLEEVCTFKKYEYSFANTKFNTSTFNVKEGPLYKLFIRLRKVGSSIRKCVGHSTGGQISRWKKKKRYSLDDYDSLGIVAELIKQPLKDSKSMVETVLLTKKLFKLAGHNSDTPQVPDYDAIPIDWLLK